MPQSSAAAAAVPSDNDSDDWETAALPDRCDDDPATGGSKDAGRDALKSLAAKVKAEDAPPSDDDGDDDVDRLLAAMDAGDPPTEGPQPLTAKRLREITGFDDLSCVVEAELTVDEDTATVDVLGSALPTVTDLHLNNSKVRSLRSFGTRLVHLKRLWLGVSGVEDLSGVQFMHQLTELYVPFNRISDVSPLSALLNLEVVDLEGNLIADTADVSFLRGLSVMHTLTLSGNPAAVGDGSVEHAARYRKAVLRMLSDTALSTFDDTSVADDERLAAAEEVTDDDGDTGAAAAVAAPVASGSADAEKLKAAVDAARELRVIAESVRATSGAGIEGIVSQQTRALCSRQSSSAAGARRAASAVDDKGAMPAAAAQPRAGLASAPVQLSPTKHETVRVARVKKSPPPPPSLSRESSLSAAPELSSSRKVFSGSITRTLRQAKRKPDGGLRPLDDASTPTPPGGTPPLLGASTSCSTPPDERLLGADGGEDILDETDEGVEKRKLAGEADALVRASLAHEERVMTAELNRRAKRQQRGDAAAAASGASDSDALDDDEDAVDGKKPVAAAVAEDDSNPQVVAWKQRMAAHLEEQKKATTTASASQQPPRAVHRDPRVRDVGIGLTEDEIVDAVRTQKEVTARAYRDDLLRDATGTAPGAARAGDGYEALALDDLGKGEADDGLYDDVL